MTVFYRFLLAVLAIICFVRCEKEYTPDDVFDQPSLVVEGYIENGTGALPPYVILTRSSPYTATFTADALNALFVHGADVRVAYGTDTIQLTEVCLADLAALDTALRNSVAQSIGLGGSSDSVNFCIYTDVNAFITGTPSLPRVVGGRYDLIIRADDQTLTASTTLTPYVPIDSFRIEPHPTADSLVQLLASFADPANVDNYYRIFSKRNREPMYPASSLGTGTSVTDDKIFSGQTFEFAILRGQIITKDINFDTYGYFWRGDTVVIRGATLDYAHFRFWQTLEFNSGSSGPFSSYVRIESNINGGLGIWGGISFQDYQIIIPR